MCDRALPRLPCRELNYPDGLGSREGNEYEINLCPTGQQHVAVVSKLISNYPQIVSFKGVRQKVGEHDAEQKETSPCTALLF